MGLLVLLGVYLAGPASAMAPAEGTLSEESCSGSGELGREDDVMVALQLGSHGGALDAQPGPNHDGSSDMQAMWKKVGALHDNLEQSAAIAEKAAPGKAMDKNLKCVAQVKVTVDAIKLCVDNGAKCDTALAASSVLGAASAIMAATSLAVPWGSIMVSLASIIAGCFGKAAATSQKPLLDAQAVQEAVIKGLREFKFENNVGVNLPILLRQIFDKITELSAMQGELTPAKIKSFHQNKHDLEKWFDMTYWEIEDHYRSGIMGKFSYLFTQVTTETPFAPNCDKICESDFAPGGPSVTHTNLEAKTAQKNACQKSQKTVLEKWLKFMELKQLVSTVAAAYIAAGSLIEGAYWNLRALNQNSTEQFRKSTMEGLAEKQLHLGMQKLLKDAKTFMLRVGALQGAVVSAEFQGSWTCAMAPWQLYTCAASYHTKPRDYREGTLCASGLYFPDRYAASQDPARKSRDKCVKFAKAWRDLAASDANIYLAGVE